MSHQPPAAEQEKYMSVTDQQPGQEHNDTLMSRATSYLGYQQQTAPKHGKLSIHLAADP